MQTVNSSSQVRGRRAKTGCRRSSFSLSQLPPQTPLIQRSHPSSEPQVPCSATPTALPCSFPFATGQLPGPELGQAIMDHRVSYGTIRGDFGGNGGWGGLLGSMQLRRGMPPVLPSPTQLFPHATSSSETLSSSQLGLLGFIFQN